MAMLSAGLLERLHGESDSAKARLLGPWVREGIRPVLIAGAGSSRWADYPSWDHLVEEMNTQLLDSALARLDGEAVDVFADRIKEKVKERDGDLRKYFTFIEERFAPSGGGRHLNGSSFHPLHLKLAEMPFSGFATTNYDLVLEDAIDRWSTAKTADPWPQTPSAAYRPETVGQASAPPRPTRRAAHRPETVDLCNNLGLTLQCLRSLSTAEPRRFVLHLHGVYYNAKDVILTRSDLRHAYTRRPTPGARAANEPPEAEPGPDDDVLDTLHRKVVWTLLATHNIVFFGFDPTDPFFSRVLRVFMRDFGQSKEHHFSVTPLPLYGEDKEAVRADSELKELGVSPVYYDEPTRDDYAGFERLVDELYESSRGAPSVDSEDRYSPDILKWLPGR